MKGLILAAGFGTRMGNATRDVPKPLLPVGNHRLIDWPVRSLQSAGISEIVVNLHYQGDQIQRYLTTVFSDVTFRFSMEEVILGTGGGIAFAKKYLEGGAFVIFNADIVADVALHDVIERHRSSGAVATMVTIENETAGDIRIDDAGQVRQIVNQPSNADHFHPRGFAGIHVVEPVIFDYVQPVFSSVIDDFYVPLVMEEKLITSYDHRGYWCDAGSPEAYRRITHEELERVKGLL